MLEVMGNRCRDKFRKNSAKAEQNPPAGSVKARELPVEKKDLKRTSMARKTRQKEWRKNLNASRRLIALLQRKKAATLRKQNLQTLFAWK